MEKFARFAQDSAGNLLTTGTVSVYRAGTASLASIYSADSLASPKANPFSLAAGGKVEFFGRNQIYDIEIVSGANIVEIEGIQLSAGMTSGVAADRPAAGSPDRLYFATDEGVLYQDTGSAWTIVATANTIPVKARSANAVLIGSDNGACIRATASFTQTLTAAATLGNGWHCLIVVDDTFLLTLDPDSAETINGLGTVKVAGNGKVLLRCNGTTFFLDWLDDNANAVTVADSATPDLRRDVNGSRNLSADAGTTAWTAPVLRSGEAVNVKFGTSRLLTQGASLLLSGGLSRSTVAGQVSSFRGEASSIVRETSVAAAGPVLLAATTASSSAQVDFVLSTLGAGYNKFRVEFDRIAPATDAVDFQMLFSTDAGSSFLTTLYDNHTEATLTDGVEGLRHVNETAAARGLLSHNVAGSYQLGNATNETYSGSADLHEFNVSAKGRVNHRAYYDSSNGTPGPVSIYGGIFRRSVATYNAIRFKMSSGNIASGTFKLFGVP